MEAAQSSSSNGILVPVLLLLMLGSIIICCFFARKRLKKYIQSFAKFLVTHKVIVRIVIFTISAGIIFSAYYYTLYITPKKRLIGAWESKESVNEEWLFGQYEFVFSESGNYYTPYVNYKIEQSTASLAGNSIATGEKSLKIQGKWNFERKDKENYIVLYPIDQTKIQRYLFEFQNDILILYNETGNIAYWLKYRGTPYRMMGTFFD